MSVESQVKEIIVENLGVDNEKVTEDASFVEQVRALGVSHPTLDEGLASLAALLVGTLLFAGALVSRHLFGGPSFFAPWGGMLTMLGWVLQAVAALRR